MAAASSKVPLSGKIEKFAPQLRCNHSKLEQLIRSQKTLGFCVADFATLSDERRSRSKIFPLFIWIKKVAFENLKGSNVRNFLGFRKLLSRNILCKNIIFHAGFQIM